MHSLTRLFFAFAKGVPSQYGAQSDQCSPNPQRLVFHSSRDGSRVIYGLDLASGAVSRLTQDPGRDADPGVSPDGQWIAVERNRDGDYGIYVMDWDGNQLRRLTLDSAQDQVPAVVQ